jgi:hypothetical protein
MITSEQLKALQSLYDLIFGLNSTDSVDLNDYAWLEKLLYELGLDEDPLDECDNCPMDEECDKVGEL